MPSSISPITAIRGMHDLLPAESIKWQFLEQSLSNQASSFGYQQIRTPIVEKLELFKLGNLNIVISFSLFFPLVTFKLSWQLHEVLSFLWLLKHAELNPFSCSSQQIL